jgi:hypothetical protein
MGGEIVAGLVSADAVKILALTLLTVAIGSTVVFTAIAAPRLRTALANGHGNGHGDAAQRTDAAIARRVDRLERDMQDQGRALAGLTRDLGRVDATTVGMKERVEDMCERTDRIEQKLDRLIERRV